MSQPNIMLTRIDNRLIHGQIIGGWAAVTGANLILAVNDEVANNDLEKSMMGMAAESMGFQVRFFTVAETIEKIHKASDSQKILIVCKTPIDVKALIDGGVPIKKVNVGNMHPEDGKEKLDQKVYVNKDEKEALDYIKSKVDEIFIQDTTGTGRTNY